MIISRDFTSGIESSRLAGISDRQRGYWRKTGLVKPSTRRKLYSTSDRLVLALVGELLRQGIPLQQFRRILPDVLAALPRDTAQLGRLTLILTKTMLKDPHRWVLGELVGTSAGWTGIRVSFGELLARLADRERSAEPVPTAPESREAALPPE